MTTVTIDWATNKDGYTKTAHAMKFTCFDEDAEYLTIARIFSSDIKDYHVSQICFNGTAQLKLLNRINELIGLYMED